MGAGFPIYRIQASGPVLSADYAPRQDKEGADTLRSEPLHISESEGDLARDVQSVLKRVETGGEVIVERDAQPVAVIRAAEPVRRKISECIAPMPADSTASIDPDFAKDVEAAIAAHREAQESPAWD